VRIRYSLVCKGNGSTIGGGERLWGCGSYDRASVQFEEAIEVSRPAEQAFSYIADFSNASSWDPGISEARKLTEGEVRVGSEFELLSNFRGSEQLFRYRVTELEPGRRIMLLGDGEKAVSTDEIVVTPSGSATRVLYRADIRLKGARRIAEPLLRPALNKMCRDALAGLRRELS
jgi:carbon monoxide dehydrogenase subunit G